MNKLLPVIIDCDPGHDDAIMLMLAFGSKLFDIKAITISAGNQTQEKTLRNALRILTLIEAKADVYKGCDKPLFRELIIAENVHGKTGLDGTDLPEPAFFHKEESAIHAMKRIIENSKEKITLIVTGPLTNIAAFLLLSPDLKSSIEQIVLMGGSIFRGNYTPHAEFNIHVDPEAASIIFNSGIPIVMHGLEVTHKVCFLKKTLNCSEALVIKQEKRYQSWWIFSPYFIARIGPSLVAEQRCMIHVQLPG